jgi:hypothetical protein
VADKNARRRGESGADERADERADDVFAVRVRVTQDQARAILERGTYDFGDHPNVTPNPDGTGGLDLFVTRAQATELEAEGVTVTFGRNQSARARERIAELGEGDRYDGGRVVPRGIGRKIGGRGGRGSPGDPGGPGGPDTSGSDSGERGS